MIKRQASSFSRLNEDDDSIQLDDVLLESPTDASKNIQNQANELLSGVLMKYNPIRAFCTSNRKHSKKCFFRIARIPLLHPSMPNGSGGSRYIISWEVGSAALTGKKKNRSRRRSGRLREMDLSEVVCIDPCDGTRRFKVSSDYRTLELGVLPDGEWEEEKMRWVNAVRTAVSAAQEGFGRNLAVRVTGSGPWTVPEPVLEPDNLLTPVRTELDSSLPRKTVLSPRGRAASARSSMRKRQQQQEQQQRLQMNGSYHNRSKSAPSFESPKLLAQQTPVRRRSPLLSSRKSSSNSLYRKKKGTILTVDTLTKSQSRSLPVLGIDLFHQATPNGSYDMRSPIHAYDIDGNIIDTLSATHDRAASVSSFYTAASHETVDTADGSVARRKHFRHGSIPTDRRRSNRSRSLDFEGVIDSTSEQHLNGGGGGGGGSVIDSLHRDSVMLHSPKMTSTSSNGNLSTVLLASGMRGKLPKNELFNHDVRTSPVVNVKQSPIAMRLSATHRHAEAVERSIVALLKLLGPQPVSTDLDYELEPKKQGDWDFLGESRGTRMWKRFRTNEMTVSVTGDISSIEEGAMQSNNAFAASKANAIVNAPFHAVLAVLREKSLTKVISAGYTASVTTKEQLDKQTEIVSTQMAGMFPVSPRDFLNVGHSRFLCPVDQPNAVMPNSDMGGLNFEIEFARNAPAGTRYIVANFSCDRLDYPRFPPMKKSIRGQLFLSGHVLTALADGNTYLQSIQHANPGGRIPVWFLNSILTVAPPKINAAIEKAAHKYVKTGKWWN